MSPQEQHNQPGQGYHGMSPEGNQPPEAQGKFEPQQHYPQDIQPSQAQIGMGQQYNPYAYGFSLPSYQPQPPPGAPNPYHSFYQPHFAPMNYGFGYPYGPPTQPHFQQGQPQNDQVQGHEGGAEPIQQQNYHAPAQQYHQGNQQQFQPPNQQNFIQHPPQFYPPAAPQQYPYGWAPHGFQQPFFGGPMPTGNPEPSPHNEGHEGTPVSHPNQQLPHGGYPDPPTMANTQPPETAHPFYTRVGSHEQATTDPSLQDHPNQPNTSIMPTQQQSAYPPPPLPTAVGVPYPSIPAPAAPALPPTAPAAPALPPPDVKPPTPPLPAPAPAARATRASTRQRSLAADNNNASTGITAAGDDDMDGAYITRRATRAAGMSAAAMARAQLEAEQSAPAAGGPPHSTVPPAPYGDGTTLQRYQCSAETERLHKGVVQRAWESGKKVPGVHEVKHAGSCGMCKGARKRTCDRLWPCINCVKDDWPWSQCRYGLTEEWPEQHFEDLERSEAEEEVEEEASSPNGIDESQLGSSSPNNTGDSAAETSSPNGVEDSQAQSSSPNGVEESQAESSSPAREQQHGDGENQPHDVGKQTILTSILESAANDDSDTAKDLDMGGTSPEGDANGESVVDAMDVDSSQQDGTSKQPTSESSETPQQQPSPVPSPKPIDSGADSGTQSTPGDTRMQNASSTSPPANTPSTATPGHTTFSSEQMVFLANNPEAARLFSNFTSVRQPSATPSPQQQETSEFSPGGPRNLADLAEEMRTQGHEEIGSVTPLHEKVEDRLRESDA